MLVNEIFSSIQGEGPNCGMPAVFVRLQGCNLTCKWCDTKYSWGPEGRVMSVDNVLDLVVVKAKKTKFVIITGGEPLIQELDVRKLTGKLQELGFRSAIETNGTLAKPEWWQRVIWDIDFKCPSSGVKEAFDHSWLDTGWGNRVKFVVADKRDLGFVEERLTMFEEPLSPTVIVSPMLPANFNANTAGDGVCMINEWLREVWNFCVHYSLRYSLQVHKVVWGNQKGV